MKKGKLIVLEGGDGSGKTTQCKLLLEYLATVGEVSHFDFPQYQKTVFGGLTGRCLKGEFGDFLHMSPYISSLPYMLDRAAAKEDILLALEKGHVVCDRYTPSNIGFQTAKLPESEQDAFIEFVEKGEYEQIGLPRPDMVIYLDVPRSTATNLIEGREIKDYLSKEKNTDQHEDDHSFQEKVAEVYRTLAEKRDDWHSISCVKNGDLLSTKVIHQRIRNLLSRILTK